jgi:hypothetical protein
MDTEGDEVTSVGKAPPPSLLSVQHHEPTSHQTEEEAMKSTLNLYYGYTNKHYRGWKKYLRGQRNEQVCVCVCHYLCRSMESTIPF